MSPQHDWLKSLGPGREASAETESAGEVKDEGIGAAEAGAENDAETSSLGAASAGEADVAGEADQSAQATSQAGATTGERDQSGWSGRAVGPLSGLLPGAVELKADELPAKPSAAVLVAAGGQPTSTAEGTDADGVLAGEASPETAPDEAVEVTEEPEPSLSATDDRWHAVLVGFVDDPRGSVEAARALIDQDIATHLALLARRKEAMRAALDASEDADTEALRVTLVNYRDLRKRLADVLDARTP